MLVEGLGCFSVSQDYFFPATLIQVAVAKESSLRMIEVGIENRKMLASNEAIRNAEGDLIELRWTSGGAVELHLHGYDLKSHVWRSEPAAMVIEAYASGRFPITSLGWGKMAMVTKH